MGVLIKWKQGIWQQHTRELHQKVHRFYCHITAKDSEVSESCRTPSAGNLLKGSCVVPETCHCHMPDKRVPVCLQNVAVLCCDVIINKSVRPFDGVSSCFTCDIFFALSHSSTQPAVASAPTYSTAIYRNVGIRNIVLVSLNERPLQFNWKVYFRIAKSKISLHYCMLSC